MKELVLIFSTVMFLTTHSAADIKSNDPTTFSCGLNASYIILKLTNHAVNYQDLVVQFQKEEQPSSMLAIKEVLSCNGSRTRGVQVPSTYFLDKNDPAIVYLQLGNFGPKIEYHFTVLTRADKKYGVVFLDPLFSYNKPSHLSWEDFVRMYKGFALVLE